MKPLPAQARCLILFPQSHAVISRRRKINSVQLIVLICINQRVSSVNKLCFLNFPSGPSAGALLCIFVNRVRRVRGAARAAFYSKQVGKTVFRVCDDFISGFAVCFMYGCMYYLNCSSCGVKSAENPHSRLKLPPELMFSCFSGFVRMYATFYWKKNTNFGRFPVFLDPHVTTFTKLLFLEV